MNYEAHIGRAILLDVDGCCIEEEVEDAVEQAAISGHDFVSDGDTFTVEIDCMDTEDEEGDTHNVTLTLKGVWPVADRNSVTVKEAS